MNHHGLKNTQENVADRIRQHADVVRGHDAVHPDRNDCGGFGGCALMRAEHDAEQEITDALVHTARAGVVLEITAVNRSVKR